MNADAALPPLMIVDDDDDDALLLARHLKSAGVSNPVMHFPNGGEAFMFLKKFCSPEGTSQRLPAAMFLDVNMQGLSGFDVLVWARQQSALAGMKIFMLSGANEIWDAQIAAKLGADEYLEKFPDAAVFRKLISAPRAVSSARDGGS